MSKVFKENPRLERFFQTSDGEAFYNESDAKNYAKTLEDKTVTEQVNENLIEVADAIEVDADEAAFLAQEKEALEKATTEKATADKKVVNLNTKK